MNGIFVKSLSLIHLALVWFVFILLFSLHLFEFGVICFLSFCTLKTRHTLKIRYTTIYKLCHVTLAPFLNEAINSFSAILSEIFFHLMIVL